MRTEGRERSAAGNDDGGRAAESQGSAKKGDQFPVGQLRIAAHHKEGVGIHEFGLMAIGVDGVQQGLQLGLRRRHGYCVIPIAWA